jgi:hypothetical protein
LGRGRGVQDSPRAKPFKWYWMSPGVPMNTTVTREQGEEVSVRVQYRPAHSYSLPPPPAAVPRFETQTTQYFFVSGAVDTLENLPHAGLDVGGV